MILSFKYFILNDIVKKLKRRSRWAGIIFKFKNATSEALHNEGEKKIENIKSISVHVPKHLKPVNDEQFGYYLAGLIDGQGYFTSKQQLVIEFHPLDSSLAYYLKKRIGFGSVKIVKNKKVLILVIGAKEGLKKIINLINGKIRTENKLNQIINNILDQDKYTDFKRTINLELNLNKDLNNHWLAGFTDVNGIFQIKVVNDNNILDIRLNFQIDQKKDTFLLLIKEFFGGFISYNKIKEEYVYSSDNYSSAKNLINYFDYFHLLSIKHINYLKWRKTYILIQNRSYLTKKGVDKIIKLKNTINRLSTDSA